MFKFLNLEPELFGIEINDLSLRVAKVKKKRKGFVLTSLNEIDIKPGLVSGGAIKDVDSLSEFVKFACETVKGEKLDTKYIIASLPEEKSFSQIIQMPKMSEEDLRLAVPIEAENYIPLSIDTTYLDFETINPHISDNLNHIDISVSVTPKQIVESYVACFKKADLIPCILETESQAVARALIKNPKEADPALLIDLGVSSTSFIIFSDNYVRFTSSITTSAQELTSSISHKLGISINKAEELKRKYGLTKEGEKKYSIASIIKPHLMNLVSEIKKYINFYQNHISHEYLLSDDESDGKIKKIIICGGGANLKEIFDFFAKELNMPIEMGNPLVNIVGNNGKSSKLISVQKSLSFTTVIGLALGGLDDAK